MAKVVNVEDFLPPLAFPDRLDQVGAVGVIEQAAFLRWRRGLSAKSGNAGDKEEPWTRVLAARQ
ncbi:hypothetical protein ACFXPA_41400 [Amycolatopsis sp. NPDC059090]|uniref:hypothetical protein n=1 Tax=Amycolatopsis sp. NPDC059090 TaxID=3346723 RepID=UPI0036721CB1